MSVPQVYMDLKEYGFGQSYDCSYPDCINEYSTHLETILDIKKRAPLKYHKLMHTLYQEAKK
jgi:hypothetical protein